METPPPEWPGEPAEVIAAKLRARASALAAVTPIAGVIGLAFVLSDWRESWSALVGFLLGLWFAYFCSYVRLWVEYHERQAREADYARDSLDDNGTD